MGKLKFTETEKCTQVPMLCQALVDKASVNRLDMLFIGMEPVYCLDSSRSRF